MQSHGTDERTLLEAALKHERVVLATLIVAIPLLCWAWIAADGARYVRHDARAVGLDDDRRLGRAARAALVRDVGGDDDGDDAAVGVAARPALCRRARTSGDAGVAGKTYALAAGYVLVWVLFSAAATVLQRVLSSLADTDSDDGAGNAGRDGHPAGDCRPVSIDAVEAGVPRHVPLAPFLLVRHWPDRTLAAFRLGVRHGIYCLGCCWALMLLLFAGGVMNLAVIVGLALWVMVEKFLPFGERTAQVSGWVLLAVAAWIATR
jgi:predicted metal-binding membrane protein